MSKVLEAMFLSAELQLKDNGGNAKSAPVKVLANSGQPIEYPGLGTVVWDFSTMRNKPRIPLDYVHETQEAIGYLNKFDATSSGLICGGAIVPFGADRGAEVIAKMTGGVPYQASIESHGGDLQYVAEGETALVNNVQGEIQGPGFILRDWELAAVAVCKFGRDSNTSTELMLAAAKMKKVNDKLNTKGKEMTNTDTQVEQVTAVEETPAATSEVSPAPEAETEVADTAVAKPSEVPAEESAETVEAGAEAPAEVVDAGESSGAETKAEPAKVVEAAATDPREEFKSFVAAFGAAKAAEYYSEGLSLSDAQAKHLLTLTAENEELKKRLTLAERGAAKPVKLAPESGATPKLIRIAKSK